MALIEVTNVDVLREAVGREVGPSSWRTVTQAIVDGFAEISGDDQWIHVDAARAAKESPFGTTIAHGNLTLAMVDGFRKELFAFSGFALGVNYGWNKVRLPAPVPVGSRLRCSGTIVSVDDVSGGWWQMETRFAVEVEGNGKPCFVGNSVGRVLEPHA